VNLNSMSTNGRISSSSDMSAIDFSLERSDEGWPLFFLFLAMNFLHLHQKKKK
jgi:hypothetical protein